MNARLPLAALALALTLGLNFAPSAEAYDGCGGGAGVGLAGGYSFGYGIGVGGLYNGLDRYSDYRVPYFAAHPPVYYSHPVPRTYGYSPFAYPPHVTTPEMCVSSAPLTIHNPHVPSKAAPAQKASDSKEADETVSVPVASKPLVVMNPYVFDASLANAGR